ncbi:MAG: imidazolonepropionase [Oscillospiraceae bacterium]|nr:imidazolonepropionase [Oscillospiraceae bacterium]
MDCVLTNIGTLCTPKGKTALRGENQGNILTICDAAIGIRDGIIVYTGPKNELPDFSGARIIDCGGKLVTPGLVDAHTHLVFGGWRQNELSLKLAGVAYLDILKSGGGILRTVEQTRAACENELIERGREFLAEMLGFGVTTCEAKSGYGLCTEDELKQLRVIRTLNESQPIDIAATFMGAHAVPKEYADDRAGYIELILTEMLPAVAREGIAEFCDIFCESAVFTPDESRLILTEAKKHGFTPKIHADEIDPIGGAEIAAEVEAISAEHLIMASDDGIRKMAEKELVAVLLPATSFYLDKPYARARDMVSSNLAVAVATDFNPGSSPSLNIQLAMNLACLKYKLTPAEALTAVTLNGAAAINRANTCGSLEVGKSADMVIWNAPDLDYLFYRYGSNLVDKVIKGGVMV